MLEPSNRIQHIPGSAVPVLFGAGVIDQLGGHARDLGAQRVLLVTDPGIVRAGHADHALASLENAGLAVTLFTGVAENPTTEHVAAGLTLARSPAVDLIIGLGGGSSMDCAKAINFLLTNGGAMRDYWGVNKATQPMLPFIAIPTTTGTGSEAQSAALIADPATHQKMACLDRKTLARLAILDANLTATQPPRVAALTGIDAISHAIETAGSTKRTDISRALSRAAWALLPHAYPTLVTTPANPEARARMQLGAHYAGAAIENSMLGAAHACANPLTARYGIAHGAAVGVMLPAVIRFNASAGTNPYADLTPDPTALADRVVSLLTAADLPSTLTAAGVAHSDLPSLAASAARQWTANFNPRPVTESDFLRLYQAAFA